MGEKRLRNVAFAAAGKGAAASVIGVNEGTLPERAMRRSQVERGAGVIAQAAAAVTISDKSTNHSALSIQQDEKVYQNHYVNSTAQ